MSIVFPDADLEAAADAAVNGMNFAWQGQSCGSTSRLLLHESIHDLVLEQVNDTVSSLRVGDPMDDASQMGPINSARQYKRVIEYIETGKKEGARLATGGKRPSGDRLFDRGFWLQPTVFADVDLKMTIAREEIFGPLLSVIRWTEPEETIAIANGTEYGLTAAIWSRDITTALSAAQRVRSGYVWVNSVGAHYPAAPYGGMKCSGVGREEGIEELLSYTETKAIHVALA